MATTWIKSLHRGGGTIAAALGLRTEYVLDSEKTDGGELVDSYECDPYTAQSEFLFSKRLYEQTIGRNQGKRDVLAYHVRMSFKPGEVTAEQALALGRELGLRWTKGRHQFIVAAHTNTNNPHTHIIYNAVNLDGTKKFRNFKHSSVALRRLSDLICLENGLSIVENPKLSKGWNRAEYLGKNKAPTVRDRLRDLIDQALSDEGNFDSFIAAMMGLGCEVKQGKHLAFKIPGGGKFIRCNSLGDDYTEAAILERLSGRRVVAPKASPVEEFETRNKPNLHIDIQAKLAEGKGAGFEHWASLFNLKQSAKTMMFLKENGIGSCEELVEKSDAACAEYDELMDKIKRTEKKIAHISELQKHIGAYGKTREIYKQYLASGRDSDFYEKHRADIMHHQAAKKHFDKLGLKKLPPMAAMKQEYAKLLAEKKMLYGNYKELKEKRMTLLTAKGNIERILGLNQKPQNRRPQNRTISHER